MLRDQYAVVLDELGLPYQSQAEPGFVNVVIADYPTGPGLEPPTTSLLVRLPLGFPDATPDMFWCDPPVVTTHGNSVAGTESREAHAGRTWQRWSRHIQGQWRPGIDNLATYLAYIRRCFDVAGGRA